MFLVPIDIVKSYSYVDGVVIKNFFIVYYVSYFFLWGTGKCPQNKKGKYRGEDG